MPCQAPSARPHRPVPRRGQARAACAGAAKAACLTAGLAAALALGPTASQAGQFWDNTYMVGLTLGNSLSQTVDQLGTGGYELSDGTQVDFAPWYQRQWTDLHLTMLTQYSPDFGLLWGLSAGESGPKYRIYPGFQLGLLWQVFHNGNSSLTLSVSAAVAGNLEEFPCTADYGAIGGIQQVNCRLAATSLPPKDTLQYLVQAPSPDNGLVSLTYSLRF